MGNLFFNSSKKKSDIAAILIVVFLFLVATPMEVNAETSTCPPPPGRPWDPIFHDLKGVNLFVEINERNDMELKPTFWKQNLTALAVEKITNSVMPFIQRDASCKSPEVNILDRAHLSRAVNEPQMLTYTVTASFFIVHDEPVAAIRMYSYRSDAYKPDYNAQVFNNGGLELISPNEYEFEIKRRLKEYFDNVSNMTVFYGERDNEIR